jgi:hypothetical protein
MDNILMQFMQLFTTTWPFIIYVSSLFQPPLL